MMEELWSHGETGKDKEKKQPREACVGAGRTEHTREDGDADWSLSGKITTCTSC